MVVLGIEHRVKRAKRIKGAQIRTLSKQRGHRTMAKFRFQDLRTWQLAIEIANDLFDIADDLEKKRLYRFADQLRGSGMSMSNNISEGSGPSSKKEFKRFLDISRRSTFENANFVILLQMRKLMTGETLDSLLDRLDGLCRQITSFQYTL